SSLMQEMIHPEDAAGVERKLQSCFQTGDASVLRFRMIEEDGAYRWVECRVAPRYDADGAIVQWYGASIDIDDEVRARDALRQASDKLAQASQAARDRKSTRLNSSHVKISYAVFCLKKKKKIE